ncbi:MAG: hypothetical protein AAF998_01530 [Bacteroidota bacterium]
MEISDIEFLQSPRGQELIAGHREMDPGEFALRHAGADFPVAAVATQLKYRARAQKKLPTWYAWGTIFPPRAFEQCSSEAAAALKPLGTGTRAVDLTAGLGVDAVALAAHYTEVIAVERDPALVALGQWNLHRLGIPNVRYMTGTAEEFVRTYTGPRFDLVFCDPDRRDAEGQRRFALADCRPDIRELRAPLTAMAERVMVKLSPMLDLRELERQLTPLDRLSVLAIDQEVKEILVEWGAGVPFRRSVAFVRRGRQHRFEAPESGAVPLLGDPEPGHFLYESDVSLYKAGLVPDWWAQEFPHLPGAMNHPEAYRWSPERIADFPGRTFRIRESLPYQPKRVKKFMAVRGIRRANLSRRCFDVPLAQVRSRLGIKEGGSDYLIFTRRATGERIVFLADRLL